MPEISVLICVRVADGEPHVQSTVERCAACDQAVWLAESSPKVDRLLCIGCAKADVKAAQKAGADIQTMPLTPEQERELERYFEDT